LVTSPVDVPDAADAEVAGELVAAGLLAAAELAGAELELELELQAAAPTTRQAPTAAIRHLEPTLIRRDIPVKRVIAPCRLSAVNSPVPAPPLHAAADVAGVQN
jgi:hypothetical protein